MARSSDAVFPLSLIRDKTFQMRQIRRVLWLTLFFIAQSTIVLGLFYHQFLGDLVSGNAPLLFASEDMVSIEETVPGLGKVLTSWLLVMLVINAAVTFVIVWYVMRRLGNPILAMHRALNEIGDGNLGVRLRTGDENEFSELSTALNRALDKVHGRIAEAQALTRILDSVDEQPAPDPIEIRAALLACRDVLDHFKDLPEHLGGEAVNDQRTERASGS